MHTHAPMMVPDLLQTPAYARGCMGYGVPDGAGDFERMASHRVPAVRSVRRDGHALDSSIGSAPRGSAPSRRRPPLGRASGGRSERDMRTLGTKPQVGGRLQRGSRCVVGGLSRGWRGDRRRRLATR
ncbi:hypothetical protein ACWCPF_42630 [Streptomyces sp. NPDC001858]